jgi:hypothetical protein
MEKLIDDLIAQGKDPDFIMSMDMRLWYITAFKSSLGHHRTKEEQMQAKAQLEQMRARILERKAAKARKKKQTNPLALKRGPDTGPGGPGTQGPRTQGPEGPRAEDGPGPETKGPGPKGPAA